MNDQPLDQPTEASKHVRGAYQAMLTAAIALSVLAAVRETSTKLGKAANQALVLHAATQHLPAQAGELTQGRVWGGKSSSRTYALRGSKSVFGVALKDCHVLVEESEMALDWSAPNFLPSVNALTWPLGVHDPVVETADLTLAARGESRPHG